MPTDPNATVTAAQQVPLFIGFVVMAVGSLAIYAHGSRDPEYRHHTNFHSLVPFIAATAYLGMALGTGVLTLNGEQLFLARYMDWSVTTPLLLTGLVLTALHEHGRHSSYVTPIIVLDVIMIVTGLLAAITADPAYASGDSGVRWIWYAWSCSAFAGVLYMLWAPLKSISGGYGGRVNEIYKGNLVFLTVVWLIYPVVFFIGPQGIRATDATTNVWIILVLDTIAKVVYGFVVTSKFKALPDSGKQPRASA